MQFQNAVYMNAERTCFDVDVTLDDGTKLPYTFNTGINDVAPVFQAIKEAFERGEIQVSDYVPTVIPYEVLAFEIRDRRNDLLTETDYIMQPDYPISEETRTDLKAYRQALRDITKQNGFPTDVVWPEKPAFIK